MISEYIRNISIAVLGEIPVEYSFCYTIMDALILFLIVLCILSPLILLYKMLRW